MGKVVYWMTVSLDGFVETRDGSIDWSMPDEELFRFHTDYARTLGAFLNGRRTYEAMASFWPTAGLDPSAPTRVGELPPALVAEFARVWRSKPKVVFSKTLGSVGHNCRVARDDVAVEVARTKQEVEGDLGLGGATLAATFMQRGLIDEYRLFVRPIVLGGGKPYFTALDRPIALRLAETRTFPGGVVLLRYERAVAI
jgi:dihydrofolate reductase